MTNYLTNLSSLLANDRKLTGYDFWRALQSLNDALHRIERERRPVPINLLYTRKALEEALTKRSAVDQAGR